MTTMRRALLAVLILSCFAAHAVDSVTAESLGGTYTKVVWSWTADGSGNATARCTTAVPGIIFSVYTEPSADPLYVPSDNYDLTVQQAFVKLDASYYTFATDLASGSCLNRDNAAPDHAVIAFVSVSKISGYPYLSISNAGSGKKGKVELYIMRNYTAAVGVVDDFTVGDDLWIQGGDINTDETAITVNSDLTVTGAFSAASMGLTTPLPVAEGGSGADTAAGARTNLGVAIGTNVQAWDADLDTLAGFAKADNTFIVGNGTAWAVETASDARTSLALVPGTNVEAWDNDLDDIAALTHAARNIMVSDGTDWTSRAMQAADVPTLNQNTTGSAANASALLTKTWASPDAIGATTPAAGAFTTGAFSGAVTLSGASGQVNATNVANILDLNVRAGETINGTAVLRIGRSTNSGTGTFSVLVMKGDNTNTNTITLAGTTGNITTAGDITASGGDLDLGVSGTTRGTIDLFRGSGSDTPGYVMLEEADGTDNYIFTANDGTVRGKTTAPDGTETTGQRMIDPASPPAFTNLTLTNSLLFNDTDVLSIGNYAQYSNTSGTRTIGIGNGALYSNATASDLIGIGYMALETTDGAGNLSIALGNYALHNNTTGAVNIAIGHSALENNTIKNWNIAIGQNAIQGNGTTPGQSNTAIGVNSQERNNGGDYNVTIGNDSMLTGAMSGQWNTGVGFGNFYGLTSGSTNTGVGKYAFASLLTGSGNTGLGAWAGYYETGSNSFYVNNVDQVNTAGDKAYSLLYGTFSGTGGSKAGQQLTVNGDVNVGTVLKTSTVTTFTADDTTPTVAAGNLFIVPISWSAGHNITRFDDGVVGQTIRIVGTTGDCTVVDGGNLFLAGHWTASSGYTLTLTMFSAGYWHEVGRSDN